MKSVFRAILGLFLSTHVGQMDLLAQAESKAVTINDYLLTTADIEQIKQIYGVEPLPGNYWYDTRSGAFGNMGGPVIGVMYSGHQIGQMRTDVSNGNSGVFINGRQLQSQEAFQAARLFGYPAPVPGKYWLDANGNLGLAGYAMPIGNIYAAMAKSSHQNTNSGDNFWSQGLYGSGNYYQGSNGQPSQGYVSVPGYGPISFGMN